MDYDDEYQGDDYQYLLEQTEYAYDNLGDLDIESLEYLIFVCDIIIAGKVWREPC